MTTENFFKIIDLDSNGPQSVSIEVSFDHLE